MNEAERIIVIFLAVFLALFLSLAVFLVIEALKVMKGVKRVVVKAETIVTSAESITEVFNNVSGPLAAVKLVQNIMKMVNKSKKGKS
jgi:asparagine N-glycosylation enzyme membrane subunit Stt3